MGLQGEKIKELGIALQTVSGPGLLLEQKEREDVKNDEIPKGDLRLKTILNERERMAGQKFTGSRRGVR